MPFDPHRAAIRFGTGLSPVLEPPASVAAMLAALAGPDLALAALPGPQPGEALALERAHAAASRAAREGGTAAERAAAEAERRRIRGEVEPLRMAQLRAHLARLVAGADGLRERLALFWADHFTVEARTIVGRVRVAPYAQEAIRPHVAGRFGDLLAAAVLHPVMLSYLDQVRSVGPGSRAGLRGGRGLNENLARELLELHTVGVGAAYGQGDVRELAELLTGLTVDAEGALAFRPGWAEPGAETVLGAAFPAEAGLATIRAALDHLAARPETARHLSRKLAVHFVADAPDEGLVGAMAEEWSATGGDLLAVVGAMLGHEAAWAPAKAKVKPPIEVLASGLRALGVEAGAILALDLRATRRFFANPLAVMGQPWQDPSGPDGWPEEAEAWVVPQFMAARIDWAMNRPEELVADLPDPRDVVRTALGPDAREEVAFAARAAERRSEGIGVILASADFQRR